MKRQDNTGKEFSRRDFITTTAVGVGAAGLGLSSTVAPAAAPPERWDVEADVVVVGYGGAGAVTAIAAHDKGSKVLIIEKQAETGHTSNTRMSLAVIVCPTNVNDAIAHMNIACRVTPDLPDSKDIDDETIKIWAETMTENLDYLRGLGVHDFRIYYDSGIEPS